jgi:hypothetical protein
MPSGGGDRSGLLAGISGFNKNKLKKAQTVDKSKPVVSNSGGGASPSGGAPSGSASPSKTTSALAMIVY